MIKWRHLFGSKQTSVEPVRERLEAKVKELQARHGIDDDALRALQRRLQTEIEMLEQMRSPRQ